MTTSFPGQPNCPSQLEKEITNIDLNFSYLTEVKNRLQYHPDVKIHFPSSINEEKFKRYLKKTKKEKVTSKTKKYNLHKTYK